MTSHNVLPIMHNIYDESPRKINKNNADNPTNFNKLTNNFNYYYQIIKYFYNK